MLLRVLLVLSFLVCFVFANKPLDVTLQLQWKNAFEFAGFYIAKQKGYYKNIGVNLNIKEWDTNIDIVKDLDANKVQFAVLRPSSIIDISKGSKIVYLLAIYQQSPLVVLADKSSKLKSVKDFKHKKIMSTNDHFLDVSLLSLISSNGLTKSDFTTIPHSFNVQDLLDKKVDAMVSYISNEPFVLQELGGHPVVFSSQNLGFVFYNDILSVNKDFLYKYPDLVKNFKQATLKGFQYAFTHKDETIDLILEKYNFSLKKTRKAIEYEYETLKKILYDKEGHIGTMKEEHLKSIYDAYKLSGLIDNNIHIKDILYHDILNNMSLSKDEQRYLQTNNTIKLCADPDWYPFDKLDENGKQIGISADFIKIIKKFLNIQVETIVAKTWKDSLNLIKQKKCDIITSITKTKNRDKFLNFTAPYISTSLVIATKNDIPFVDSINALKMRKIGIEKEHAFIEIAKEKYPQIRLIEVDSIDQGLKKVQDGEIFGMIDTLVNVSYKLQEKELSDLKISGRIAENWGLRMGIRKDNPVLLSIFKKAISQVTPRQKRAIFNKWITLKYESKPDYELIKKIVLIGLIFLIFIIIWIANINMKNKLLRKAQEEIRLRNEELKILATIDKLTGVYNRFMLDEALHREINKANRYNTKLGVVMIDIDHFKSINDKFGHQVGDEVLKKVAFHLKGIIRSTDFIGRYGGEEFLMICLEISKENLVELTEKIRLHINQQHFIDSRKVTCSFGVSVFVPGDSSQSILKRADDALYKAKKTGRNRVVSL